MGFGTIFATIGMVVIIGISSYLFITGALFTMDTLSNSLKIANEIDNERLKTEIEIGNVSVTPSNPGSGSEINVSINNTGATKILNSEFEHIDVFVYYHNDTVGTIHRWIPFNDTGYSALQDNEWTVVDVTPDLINPGIFDPDEQIKIVIRVEPAISGTKQNGNWTKIVMPNGVSASKYF
jgi:flagellar protein FlaF